MILKRGIKDRLFYMLNSSAEGWAKVQGPGEGRQPG